MLQIHSKLSSNEAGSHSICPPNPTRKILFGFSLQVFRHNWLTAGSGKVSFSTAQRRITSLGIEPLTSIFQSPNPKL